MLAHIFHAFIFAVTELRLIQLRIGCVQNIFRRYFSMTLRTQYAFAGEDKFLFSLYIFVLFYQKNMSYCTGSPLYQSESKAALLVSEKLLLSSISYIVLSMMPFDSGYSPCQQPHGPLQITQINYDDVRHYEHLHSPNRQTDIHTIYSR